VRKPRSLQVTNAPHRQRTPRILRSEVADRVARTVRVRAGLRDALAASLLVVSLAVLAACGGAAMQTSPDDRSSEGETASTTPAPAIPPDTEEGTRLTVIPDGSEARYRVQEQLVGRDLPNDAVGATSGVSGEVVVGPDSRVVPEQSRITADMASLQSDSGRRDGYVRENTLETGRFSTAEFVLREAPGLPTPLPTSGEEQFQLVGDLTVHGVTRPVTWEATARFGEEEVAASASTQVRITDFGMTPPQVGPVLGIEDEAILELDVRLRRDILET
jgi:polyisoprenoid-binding protein YceI